MFIRLCHPIGPLVHPGVLMMHPAPRRRRHNAVRTSQTDTPVQQADKNRPIRPVTRRVGRRLCRSRGSPRLRGHHDVADGRPPHCQKGKFLRSPSTQERSARFSSTRPPGCSAAGTGSAPRHAPQRCAKPAGLSRTGSTAAAEKPRTSLIGRVHPSTCLERTTEDARQPSHGNPQPQQNP
jgi:hypothetical protein